MVAWFDYKCKKWNLDTLIKVNVRFHSLNRDSNGELYVFAFNPATKKGTMEYLTHYMNKTITKSYYLESKDEPISLTNEDIKKIVSQGVDSANKVKSAFRVDSNGTPVSTKMHISIIKRGEPKAKLVHSMEDAWDGSKDISKSKAYTAMGFSSNQNALTSRTIGVASQPGSPLWQIGNSNNEGGIIEFPGGIPLYKSGSLVGAVGVSGDGVDQDETVAREASVGFEAGDIIKSDTVTGLDYFGEAAENLDE